MVDEPEGMLIYLTYWKHEGILRIGEASEMAEFKLEGKTTAIVLIDLQNGIVGMQTAPYAATDVVAKGAALTAAGRNVGATAVYVHVDLANFVQLEVDKRLMDPNAPPPPSATEFVPEAGLQSGDIVITKRSWCAFSRTNLEEQLRAKGIKTIVIGGIATNFGVESTARSAAGLGFNVVFAEDAMTTISADAQQFAIENVFPRLGRVRSTAEILASFA